MTGGLQCIPIQEGTYGTHGKYTGNAWRFDSKSWNWWRKKKVIRWCLQDIVSTDASYYYLSDEEDILDDEYDAMQRNNVGKSNQSTLDGLEIITSARKLNEKLPTNNNSSDISQKQSVVTKRTMQNWKDGIEESRKSAMEKLNGGIEKNEKTYVEKDITLDSAIYTDSTYGGLDDEYDKSYVMSSNSSTSTKSSRGHLSW